MIIWQQARFDQFLEVLFRHDDEDKSPEENLKHCYQAMMVTQRVTLEYLNWLFDDSLEKKKKTAAVQILNNCDLFIMQFHQGCSNFWMVYAFAYRGEDPEDLSIITDNWKSLTQRKYEKIHLAYREEDLIAAKAHAEEQLKAKGYKEPFSQYIGIEDETSTLINNWLVSNGVIEQPPFKRCNTNKHLEYIDLIQGERTLSLTEVTKEINKAMEVAPFGIELDEKIRRLKAVYIEDVSTYQHAIFDSSVQLGF